MLDTLPAEDARRLWPHLQETRLAAGDVVMSPETDPAVLFPVGSVVGWMTCSDGPVSVEVATAGSDGLVGGATAVIGAPLTSLQAVCHVPGRALRVDAATFRAEARRSRALQRRLGRFVGTLLVQFAQSALCGRRHSTDERLARWLLLSHDRVQGDLVHVTHHTLAHALGIRRPAASLAAETLQASGAIRCHRGRIAIADRTSLERTSCECYTVIREELDSFLDSLTAHPGRPRRDPSREGQVAGE